MRRLIDNLEMFLEAEGGFKLNVATVPLAKARKYAEGVFKKAGKSLGKELPDFDKNYTALQKATKAAPDIPRIQMPVIEPSDMDEFHKRLNSGRLDIFKPYTDGKLRLAKSTWNKMDKTEGDKWVELGTRDGDKKDDIVKAKWTKIPGKSLKPTQSQIWLEKLVANIVKWGIPASGSPVLKTTVIASKEGYILDGHHRYGKVMLGNPDLKMSALKVPLKMDMLLKVGRSYGGAVGNEPKG